MLTKIGSAAAAAGLATATAIGMTGRVEALNVIPNGGWAPGANAVVVEGPSSAAEAAAAIAAQSGYDVGALWVLYDAQWLFFTPAAPGVSGGLDVFPDYPAAAIAVLGVPGSVAPPADDEPVSFPDGPPTAVLATYDVMVVFDAAASTADVDEIAGLFRVYDADAAIHVQQSTPPVLRARVESDVSGLCPIVETQAELRPAVVDLACAEIDEASAA